VYANIQKFIQFQLTVNVGALVINVVAAVSSGDVPLNTVQVSLSLSLSHIHFLSVDHVNHSLCINLLVREHNGIFMTAGLIE
jgi:magnesium-transporting ATPase (P-type)